MLSGFIAVKSSCSCLDCSKEIERKVSTLRAEYAVEWVIERESVGKLGTVTDLASVSLRSISAGLKLNTARLQHAPPYLFVLRNPFITGSDAGDVDLCCGCLLHVKLDGLIYRRANVYVDS